MTKSSNFQKHESEYVAPYSNANPEGPLNKRAKKPFTTPYFMDFFFLILHPN